jgi:hypothetical protein
MYNIVIYYYVLIVFSLRRESLKLILATDPFRGGSVTEATWEELKRLKEDYPTFQLEDKLFLSVEVLWTPSSAKLTLTGRVRRGGQKMGPAILSFRIMRVIRLSCA